MDHRHRISETNAGIQQLAKGIKERITALHGPEAAGGAAASAEQKAKAKKLLQDFANILQVGGGLGRRGTAGAALGRGGNFGKCRTEG